MQCAIALGSNLGDSKTILNSAIETLDRTVGITVQKYSSWYLTKPIGPPQPDILNGCALLQTTQTPQQLLQTLLSVEAQFGRVRRERWGARTLDLDLLLFDDVILNLPELQIPHPRMVERAFVLVPLVEIAPDWVEPISGRTIVQLIQAVDCADVRKL